MTHATRLNIKAVEKPWGRFDLPAIFPNPDARQIGEIWFDGPAGQQPALLVKYIFTSEKLSVQVHPNDDEAHQRGLPGGKSECWYVLDAEPDARLGIGLTRPLDAAALREAALDGSIEHLLDWKPVVPGAFFYIPAGTVHAIGAGVTLVEVQQNQDITYRLYDYGRPRELHLDDGVAVSKPARYAAPDIAPDRIVPLGSNVTLLGGADAPFTLHMVAWDIGDQPDLPDGTAWFIPITGAGMIDGAPWSSSECWLTEGGAQVEVTAPTHALIATL